MSFGQTYDDPDDQFAHTRMPFGDHIEELRGHLIRALIAFGICMVIGFVLDGIGAVTGWPIGLGRPAYFLITDTVRSQVKQFYDRRIEKELDRLQNDTSETATYKQKLEVEVTIRTADLQKAFPGLPPPTEERVPVQMTMTGGPIGVYVTRMQQLIEKRNYLTALNITEPLVVYVKVTLVCGLLLSSPIVFYELWSFVAAGLYRHEKKLVHHYLPFSVGLFLGGALFCQFVVMPKAIGALLTFNEWLDIDPDLRLNEWLSFAILLPLVFGISFQTPLVMLFLNRLGMFSSQVYWAKWRYALMVMAFAAMLLTPTPDAITMLFLLVPMFGLYLLGVLLCVYFERYDLTVDEPEDEEVAV